MQTEKITSIISYLRDFFLDFIKWCRSFYSVATHYVEDPFPAEEDPNLKF